VIKSAPEVNPRDGKSQMRESRLRWRNHAQDQCRDNRKKANGPIVVRRVGERKLSVSLRSRTSKTSESEGHLLLLLGCPKEKNFYDVPEAPERHYREH
jgi:hypothetical protein